MSKVQKHLVCALLLACVPAIAVQALKQSSWGTALATPKARQLGDPSAPVIILEYSDFQCPACARAVPVVKSFLDMYKGKIRIAFKYFPLRTIHPNALASAHAAQCAAEQNQFWPYGDKLFETQPQWAPLTNPTTHFMAIAQDLHLDAAKFSSCFADPAREKIIEADAQEGKARNVNATPTFFVGDQRLVGGVFDADGARAIERELRK